MKKVENIIESCWECRHCRRYVSVSDEYIGEVRFCGNRDLYDWCDRDRLIRVLDDDVKELDMPPWCPLETYKEAEKSEAQPAPAVATPCTIILPGMPHLEWMTENLSGFGGTEINGQTYYTYDEAEEAVKQMGNGWRLPTRGEMVDLDDLGSVWQKEGPHGLPGRLFGGGLFLEAAGYRTGTSGDLINVFSGGDYWSSSPQSGSTNAGYLDFNSTYVYPLSNASRAFGFPVRCVRNVK